MDELFRITLFTFKKLELAKPHEIDIINELIHKSEFQQVIDPDNLTKVKEIILSFGVPEKIDALTFKAHEDKERSKKVANFLYDMIFLLQSTGNQIIFNDSLKNQLIDLFYL